MSEPKLGPYGRFLNDLLTDPALLRRFLKNMNAVMEEYHLSEAQRVALLSGDHALIEATFAAENPHSASSGFVRAPSPPPGSGGSVDSSGFVRVSDLITAVDIVKGS